MGTGAGGRPTKINVVLDRLDEIIKAKSNGMTDTQLCKMLGISTTSLANFARKDERIKNALTLSTINFVATLRGELARKALPHTLEKKKQYVKKDLETGHETRYTEITTQEVDGDTGAIHLLLKNLDGENWKESWDIYRFKKEELELKRKEIENKSF